MAIFGPKPCVNPFGKMSIFRLVELLVFMTQKGVFGFQNIIESFFWSILRKKKKLQKWPFLDQNRGLTPQEKCQFFDFLNFLFLCSRKAFFRSRISQNTFSQSILRTKKKVGKMAIFRPKPWINPFGRMSIFGLLELLVFIAQKGVFSFQNIIEYLFLVYIA